MLGCGVLFYLPLRADDIAQAGRNIEAKYQDSVVTLKITVKVHTSMNGEQNTDDGCYNWTYDFLNVICTRLLRH